MKKESLAVIGFSEVSVTDEKIMTTSIYAFKELAPV